MQPAPATLDHTAQWALLPIVNHTQTPQAGLRAEAILASLIRTGGVSNLMRYPSELNSESLFEPAERAAVEKAMTWAQEQGATYALTGTVDEWRYKVGVDGEPAVGITLQLIDMQSDRVLWSAAGGKTGWSREALSAVAHKLLAQLSEPLALKPTQDKTKAGTPPKRSTLDVRKATNNKPVLDQIPTRVRTLPVKPASEPKKNATSEPASVESDPTGDQDPLELPPADKPVFVKPAALVTPPAPGEDTVVSFEGLVSIPD